MGKNTKVDWTDHTWNPWWGCTKLANRQECDNCYAYMFARRLGMDLWGPRSERRFASDKVWHNPFLWDEACAKAGRRDSVFCMSMGDLFEARPELVFPRQRALRTMRDTPHLTWLVLTKRLLGARQLLNGAGLEPGGHVLLGTTIGTVEAALDVGHGPVDFISCEPLLEYIDIANWLVDGAKTVIIGPETHGASVGRVCKEAWMQHVIDQADRFGAKVFVKAMAIGTRISHDVDEWPEWARRRDLSWRNP